MTFNDTGHIPTSGQAHYKKPEDLDKYMGLVKAKISSIDYVDSDLNSSFERYGFYAVEYTCTIIGGPYDGVQVEGVIDSTLLGGKFNYQQTLRTPSEQASNETGLEDTPNQLGDYVLLMFLYGDLNYGVIINGMPHGGNEELAKATREKGIQSTARFNGVEMRIDDKGNTRFSKNNSQIILNELGDLLFNAFGSPGDIKDEVSPQLSFKFDKAKKTITLSANNKTMSINDDGDILIKNESTSLTAKSSELELKSDKIILNKEMSGITTEKGHQGVIDLVTGVPVTASKTIFGDV